MLKVARLLNQLARLCGYEIKVFKPFDAIYGALEPEFDELCRFCMPFSMATRERMYALYQAVDHVLKSSIRGDFVECGVWKGGSSMLMAKLLHMRQEQARMLYLYDTFEGMPIPQSVDKKIGQDVPALVKWNKCKTAHGSDWCYGSKEEVYHNILSTELNPSQLIMVEGKVEDTIPQTTPSQISILRLDTDFYSSTLHELIHLYPRLAVGGVLILDDYGSWSGAKQAVDEYFISLGQSPLLIRIDTHSRILVKTTPVSSTTHATLDSAVGLSGKE